jgi:hypothetical protein
LLVANGLSARPARRGSKHVGIAGESTRLVVGVTELLITEVHFFHWCYEVESVELARNAFIKIGDLLCEFSNKLVAPGLEFHDNGHVMSGKLAKPDAFVVGGQSFVFDAIGFYEDGTVSGGHLIENTAVRIGDHEYVLRGEQSEYFNGYSVCFHRSGEIDWADLADGSTYRH